jgi:hypothetical protein
VATALAVLYVLSDTDVASVSTAFAPCLKKDKTANVRSVKHLWHFRITMVVTQMEK